ncbi:hypothetical protein PoB_007587700 [Plakobranchus ocellatus]|uniref:Uncharacterized protein n=1 Tax=Plakobranchus ocellatus TaxID=259542 RepID=A0AAV4DZA7_9GAST|nr:hypothetical protein PoB_007587700 [Plakobranchus ocellatus]
MSSWKLQLQAVFVHIDKSKARPIWLSVSDNSTSPKSLKSVHTPDNLSNWRHANSTELLTHAGGFGDAVDSESALRAAGITRSQVRAPSPVPWPDGGPEK